MIAEKKLLCAFIYSAYASGYCGLRLAREEKERHMQLYLDYLKKEQYYPAKEIEETQQEMMDSIKRTSIRDYIYNGHFDVVRNRIATETHQTFEDAVKSPIICMTALRCAANFYLVIQANNSTIIAQNLFLPEKKELTRLEGLELPSVGEIVTGHWNYLLERTNDWELAKKYQKYSEDHIFKTMRRLK